jgi:hypothetical protein
VIRQTRSSNWLEAGFLESPSRTPPPPQLDEQPHSSPTHRPFGPFPFIHSDSTRRVRLEGHFQIMSGQSVEEEVDQLLHSIRTYRFLIEDQSAQVDLNILEEWVDQLSRLENRLASVQSSQREASQSVLETYTTPESSRKAPKAWSVTSNPTTPSKPSRSDQGSIKASGWTAPLISPSTRALPSESPHSKIKSDHQASPTILLNRSMQRITPSSSKQYSMSPSKFGSPAGSSMKQKVSSSDSSSNVSSDSRPSTPQEASSSSFGDLTQTPSGNSSSSHLKPASRKRTFGELGSRWENVDGSGSKSRRTTPSLSVTEQNTPSTTDDESSASEPNFEENQDPCAGYVLAPQTMTLDLNVLANLVSHS